MVLRIALREKLARVIAKIYERYQSKLELVKSLNFIQQCPAWGRKEVISKVCRMMELKLYAKDMKIMDQSLATFNLYIIVSGEVGCMIGERTLQKKLKPGQSFGELAVTFNRACKTSYVTLETTQLYVLSKVDIPSILRDFQRQYQIKLTQNVFKSCFLFADLDLGTLSYINYHSVFIHYAKSHRAYSIGQPPDGLYIVMDGEFSYSHKTKTVQKQAERTQSTQQNEQDTSLETPADQFKGDDQACFEELKANKTVRYFVSKVRTFGVGSCFGEDELIKKQPRRFDAVCESATGTLLFLSSAVFFHLIFQQPSCRTILMDRLSTGKSIVQHQISSIEQSIDGYEQFIIGKNFKRSKSDSHFDPNNNNNDNESPKRIPLKKQDNPHIHVEKTFSGLPASMYGFSKEEIEAKQATIKRKKIEDYNTQIQIALTPIPELIKINEIAKQFNQQLFFVSTEEVKSDQNSSNNNNNSNSNNNNHPSSDTVDQQQTRASQLSQNTKSISSQINLEYLKLPKNNATASNKTTDKFDFMNQKQIQPNEIFQLILKKNSKQYGSHYERIQTFISNSDSMIKKNKMDYQPHKFFGNTSKHCPSSLMPKISSYFDEKMLVSPTASSAQSSNNAQIQHQFQQNQTSEEQIGSERLTPQQLNHQQSEQEKEYHPQQSDSQLQQLNSKPDFFEALRSYKNPTSKKSRSTNFSIVSQQQLLNVIGNPFNSPQQSSHSLKQHILAKESTGSTNHKSLSQSNSSLLIQYPKSIPPLHPLLSASIQEQDSSKQPAAVSLSGSQVSLLSQQQQQPAQKQKSNSQFVPSSQSARPKTYQFTQQQSQSQLLLQSYNHKSRMLAMQSDLSPQVNPDHFFFAKTIQKFPQSAKRNWTTKSQSQNSIISHLKSPTNDQSIKFTNLINDDHTKGYYSQSARTSQLTIDSNQTGQQLQQQHPQQSDSTSFSALASAAIKKNKTSINIAQLNSTPIHKSIQNSTMINTPSNANNNRIISLTPLSGNPPSIELQQSQFHKLQAKIPLALISSVSSTPKQGPYFPQQQTFASPKSTTSKFNLAQNNIQSCEPSLFQTPTSAKSARIQLQLPLSNKNTPKNIEPQQKRTSVSQTPRLSIQLSSKKQQRIDPTSLYDVDNNFTK